MPTKPRTPAYEFSSPKGMRMPAATPSPNEGGSLSDRTASPIGLVSLTIPLFGVGLITCVTERITDAAGRYLYTHLKTARDSAGRPLDAMNFDRVRRLLKVH